MSTFRTVSLSRIVGFRQTDAELRFWRAKVFPLIRKSLRSPRFVLSFHCACYSMKNVYIWVLFWKETRYDSSVAEYYTDQRPSYPFDKRHSLPVF